ncbi:hypothetical protein [Cytobacillus horneckiae]|uniref:hypothetical protein n=1 Tax=Cytobacillus horneckiae TaxID=549687 RepID=UPI003D9A16BC
MKKKYIISILILLIIAISLLIYFSSNSNYEHSTTINVKVSEKIKKDDLYIEFQMMQEAKKVIKVKVNNENTWNLLEIDRDYFVVISWTSKNQDTDIENGQNLILEQVEILN